MTAAILAIIASALDIWDNKLKQKYKDQYLSLEKQWWDTWNKQPSEFDANIIDKIEFQIKILAQALAQDMKQK